MKKYTVLVIEDLYAESASDALQLFQGMVGDPENTDYEVSIREREEKSLILESFYRSKGNKELTPSR